MVVLLNISVIVLSIVTSGTYPFYNPSSLIRTILLIFKISINEPSQQTVFTIRTYSFPGKWPPLFSQGFFSWGIFPHHPLLHLPSPFSSRIPRTGHKKRTHRDTLSPFWTGKKNGTPPTPEKPRFITPL